VGTRLTQVADFAYERLFAGKYRTSATPSPQPTYRVALIKWALQSGRMTFVDIESLLRNEKDWWVRQSILVFLEEARFGRPSFNALLNLAMRAGDPDTSRVAASLTYSHGGVVDRPYDECHWAARLLLRNVGLIPYAGRPPSLIPGVLAYSVKFGQPYTWQKLFGSDHVAAEKLAIISKQRFETDIDAFVVSLDSFCDLLTRHIFRHRGHVMKTAYGNALTSGAPSWLRADFPQLLNGFGRLHDLRIRSFTAHPRDLKSGRPNRRITHARYYRVRPSLLLALNELRTVLPL
jgi:hypothetical protein